MPTISVVNQPRKRHGRLASSAVRQSRLLLFLVIVITLLAPVLSTLHSFDARRVDASTTPAPETGPRVTPTPPPSDDQIMNFAYFIDQGDMTSMLRLNNNLLEAATATVTFFNSRGESFTAPPLTLPPQDVQRLPVAELTANAPGDFHSGSVQVFYHGPPMAVTGQVSVASATSHVMFESFPTISSRFQPCRWASPLRGSMASPGFPMPARGQARR